MKKQLTALLTATLLLTCLTGCNREENTPSDSSSGADKSSSVGSDTSSDADANTESSTDADNQTYEKLYEELYYDIYYNIYQDVYIMTTREVYVENYTPPQNCGKIDRSLDCEQIVLDRANALKKMMTEYYGLDSTKLAFKKERNNNKDMGWQFRYKVNSDEFNSYSKFKKLFTDSIYDNYIDKINYTEEGFREKDGILYFSDSAGGGTLGTGETWYLGYDVEDDRIIGHFAELLADTDSFEPFTIPAEHLNDESNYNFYDIIIQNVDGNYVITDCVGDYDCYFIIHGWNYNNGFADRSLITNPKVMPKMHINPAH